MALSQIARLGLDAQPYYRGLAGVESRTESTFDKMSRKTGKHFAEGFFRTFTPAAMLTGLVGATVAAGFKGYAQAKELQAGAAKAGLSVEDYAAAQKAVSTLGDASKLTKEQFVELVDTLKTTSAIEQEATLERVRVGDKLKETWEKITEQLVTSAFFWITAMEKAANKTELAGAKFLDSLGAALTGKSRPGGVVEAIVTKRQATDADLEDYLKRLRQFTLESDTADRAALLAKLAGIQEEQADKRKEPTTKEAPGAQQITDALARIGLFVGRGGSAPGAIQRDQLTELKRINYGVDRMNKTLADNLG